MIQDIDNFDPKFLEEDDRIVAYLKGKMTAEEEQQFIKELKENPELKERTIAVARLVKGLKEVGAAQDEETKGLFLASSDEAVEAAAKHATKKQEEYTETKARAISIRKTATWLSIAASLICIVWLGFTYYNYQKTTDLGEEYADSFDTEIIVRGEEVPLEVEKKLSTLFQNVKDKKDLDETIHELSLYWELSTMEVYNDYIDYSAEIGWNLAIAHLKNNDKKEAKAMLEKLISNFEEGSTVREKAKELLKLL